MNIMLIPLSVMFTLSLVGSVILFRFLKSSATIKKKSYQAGGAIAGFILIYGLLYASFNNMYKDKNTQDLDPEGWTITGTVLMEGANINDGITVQELSPTALSFQNGSFYLNGVKKYPKKLLVLSFKGKDEYIEDQLKIDIQNENGLIESIDEKNKVITIKPVVLPKIESGGEK